MKHIHYISALFALILTLLTTSVALANDDSNASKSCLSAEVVTENDIEAEEYIPSYWHSGFDVDAKVGGNYLTHGLIIAVIPNSLGGSWSLGLSWHGLKYGLSVQFETGMYYNLFDDKQDKYKPTPSCIDGCGGEGEGEGLPSFADSFDDTMFGNLSASFNIYVPRERTLSKVSFGLTGAFPLIQNNGFGKCIFLKVGVEHAWIISDNFRFGFDIEMGISIANYYLRPTAVATYMF